MEIAFRCSALAEVSHSDSVFIIDAVFVASTGGLRYLGTERRRDSDDVHVSRTIVNWHLLATAQIVLVTSKLVSHLLDRETAPKEGAGLTILWEYQVIIVESCSGADARRLLSQLGHVEGDTCLTLGRVVYLVCLIDCHHFVIHLE